MIHCISSIIRRLSFCLLVIAAGLWASTAIAQNANLSQTTNYQLSSQLRGAGVLLTVGNGDAVFMANSNNSQAQLWRFTATGHGYYRMTSPHRGNDICLDVYNGGDQDNFGRVWGCDDYTGQHWQATGSNGAYRLTTEFRGASMCLEAFRFARSGVQLRTCADRPGQLWTLTPAG